jgi:hypothetical protein
LPPSCSQSLVFTSPLQELELKICKQFLPVVFNECENRSITLREEPGLIVFENRVLRTERIFGPEREKVVGGCR